MIMSPKNDWFSTLISSLRTTMKRLRRKAIKCKYGGEVNRRVHRLSIGGGGYLKGWQATDVDFVKCFTLVINLLFISLT